MQPYPLTISIIGAGRLGGALAIALSRRREKFRIENLVVRGESAAESARSLVSDLPDQDRPEILHSGDLSLIRSKIVLITTQDPEIEKISEDLARAVSYDPVVLHCSGALSSEILGRHKHAGSMHPLISISDPAVGAKSFAGAYFCVEGTPTAREVSELIVRELGGRPFSIETRFKPLYHASAVMASGHLTALLSVAFESLSKCGLDPENAKKVLFPLIKSTIANLEQHDPSKALTGTFARLDDAIFEDHLRSMHENLTDELIDIYLQLGLRSLHLVEERDSRSEAIDRMREKISLAKRNLKC